MKQLKWLFLLTMLIGAYCSSLSFAGDTALEGKEKTKLVVYGDGAVVYNTKEDLDQLLLEYHEAETLILLRRDFVNGPTNLDLLSSFGNLKSLTLRNGWIQDWPSYSLKSSLPTIPSLTHLAIINQKIDDAQMFKEVILNSLIKNPHIESLDLSGLYIPPEIPFFQELKQFGSIKSLELNLRNLYNDLAWFSDLSAIYDFPSLIALDIRGSLKYSPETLNLILHLPKLEELSLGCYRQPFMTHIPKNNFQFLTSGSSLKKLKFDWVDTDSVDFSVVAPHLENLSLIHIHGENGLNIPLVNNLDWRDLGKNSQLKNLEIIDTPFNVTTLEQINLITLPALISFRSNVAKGIQFDTMMPSVQELYLANSKLTGSDSVNISKIESVRVLDLSSNSINGSSLKRLKNLKNLNKLYLNHLDLRKGDFSHLKALNNLEELHLSSSQIELKQLDQLGSLSHLKILDLSALQNPNITQNEIHRLQEKLSLTQVIY